MRQHAYALAMSILNQESVSSAETPTATQLDENRLAWLALALTPGLGPRRILDAVSELSAPSQIFDLTLTELEGLRLPAHAAQYFFDGKSRKAANEEWSRVVEHGATIVTYGCSAIPECAEGNLRSAAGAVGPRSCAVCCRGRRLRSWARDILRRTARLWRRCCRAIWRRGDC